MRSGAKKRSRSSRLPLLADRVGFEPTSRLRDYLISSQGRYDHFDTYPYIQAARAVCFSVYILEVYRIVVEVHAHLADAHAPLDLHFLDVLVDEFLDLVGLADVL